MSAASDSLERGARAVRSAVSSVEAVVLGELVFDATAVRVEYAPPGGSRSVVALVRPLDEGWFGVSFPTTMVADVEESEGVRGLTAAVSDSLRRAYSGRPAVSTEEYRRTLALLAEAETVVERGRLLGPPGPVGRALAVVGDGREPTTEELALATAALELVASGVPLEWALRRAEAPA